MSKVNTIDVNQAKKLIEEGSVLLDVREKAEFVGKHIPNADWHPLSRLNTLDITQYKNKTIVVYCHSGVRSNKACAALSQNTSNTKIVNLEGGIVAWQKAGFDTVSGSNKGISLERQFALIVGALIVSFSLIAYFYKVLFIIPLIMMGAGLVAIGLTGFGGITRLIALAPWNK